MQKFNTYHKKYADVNAYKGNRHVNKKKKYLLEVKTCIVAQSLLCNFAVTFFAKC